jgi:hypothetical protein
MAEEGRKEEENMVCIYIYIYHNREDNQHYNNDKINEQLSRSVRGM